jgi:hypothetical protein
MVSIMVTLMWFHTDRKWIFMLSAYMHRMLMASGNHSAAVTSCCWTQHVVHGLLYMADHGWRVDAWARGN